MDQIVASRVVDPLMVVITLGLFFSLWLLLPRLGLFMSALLASLVSAVAFATIIAGSVPNLPEEMDVLFARFVAALIQCGIAAALVWAWRRLRA
jgi:hypothetical protein